MDPNWTGRSDRWSESEPQARGSSRLGTLAGHAGGRHLGLVAAALTAAALLAGLVLAGVTLFGAPSGSPAPGGSPVAAGEGSAKPTLGSAATASPSTAPPSPTIASTPAPTPARLPALLGAIGDSYSQGYNVSPSFLNDRPQFSWVFGTDTTHGVVSLLQRFQALGASPTVVMAAKSGTTMADAERQAELIVAATKKLAPGEIAYVTFELGTNDLCASPHPMTDPVDFGAQLQTAVGTLRAALPSGSRILMMSIPDFPHFREITQADAAAKANLAQPPSDRCAPYLGTNSPSSLAEAGSYLSRYDAILEAACGDIDSHEGVSGRLSCTYDAALLAETDFTLADLSTYDYFHPSLSGQARMADNAWQADVWATAATAMGSPAPPRP